MATKLYVGNLPFTVGDDDLRGAFERFGNVASAKVILDRDTGRSKGFGFVEMAGDDEAQQAIQGMHGENLAGRPLTVNEARPLEPRSGGGGDRGGFRDNARAPRW